MDSFVTAREVCERIESNTSLSTQSRSTVLDIVRTAIDQSAETLRDEIDRLRARVAALEAGLADARASLVACGIHVPAERAAELLAEART